MIPRWRRLIFGIVIRALLPWPCQCVAQTGTVTFYSIGLSTKKVVGNALVPVGTVSFTGWLFDGNQRVAHVQGGRFMSLHLAAGDHIFTVPYHSNRPGEKTALHLEVMADTHYCVRLWAKYVSASPFVPLGYVDSQIEQIPCREAVNEAGSYQPIAPKRVDPAVRPKLESTASFPADN